MEIKNGPEKEDHKIDIVPANDNMGVKNCIVIKKGASLIETISLAVENKAYISHETEEEAGDDEYAIQTTEGEQKLLTRDELSALLRELSGDYAE